MKTKNFIIVQVLILIVSLNICSCSKKTTPNVPDPSFGVYNDSRIVLRIQDSKGNDLLISGVAGSFTNSDIKKVDKDGKVIVLPDPKPGDPILTPVDYIIKGKECYYVGVWFENPPNGSNTSFTYYRFGANLVDTFKVQFKTLPDGPTDTFGGGGTIKEKVWHNGTLIWDRDIDNNKGTTPILIKNPK